MQPYSLGDFRATLATTFGALPPPIGVGARAFPRLGPAVFLQGYRILCCRKTEDLSAIRAMVPVECLEEKDSSEGPPCRDTLSLLSHPVLKKTGLLPEPGTRLLVYQENPGLRELAYTHGWRLLANAFRIRERWEHKARFRKRLQEAGFQVPQATVAALKDLTRAKCRTWQRKWGRRLVIQIPDFPRGGGRATFFLNHEGEVESLRHVWGEGRHRGHTFGQVLVSSWIEGPSLSMEGCVTARGTLLSPLQTQLLDLPEVLPSGDRGRFCGHQWGVPKYPAAIEATAANVLRWVGEALRAEGYRGLFGVDFALDRAHGQLYALECNPRYTSAFPTLTLLQHSLGLIPLEGFHVLAWSEGEGLPSIEDLDLAHREMPPVSQLFLFHRGEGAAKVLGELKAGRYRWDYDEGVARKVGTPLPFPQPPWDRSEFLLLDGPPPRGSGLLPGRELDMILRAIFFRPVSSEEGKLEPFAAEVTAWIYRSLGIGNG